MPWDLVRALTEADNFYGSLLNSRIGLVLILHVSTLLMR